MKYVLKNIFFFFNIKINICHITIDTCNYQGGFSQNKVHLYWDKPAASSY